MIHTYNQMCVCVCEPNPSQLTKRSNERTSERAEGGRGGRAEREREREREREESKQAVKIDQLMEAAFLQGTVGAVVAKGCADIIASAPPDPIDHLSLWLLKYVANTKITHAFFQDRELVRQQQQLREQTETKHTEMRVECAREEAEAIRRLREIQEADPYLLFDSCLKTVKAFTGRFIILLISIVSLLVLLPPSPQESNLYI